MWKLCIPSLNTLHNLFLQPISSLQMDVEQFLTGPRCEVILMLPVERLAWSWRNLVRSSVPWTSITQAGNSSGLCGRQHKKHEDQTGVCLLTITSQQQWSAQLHDRFVKSQETKYSVRVTVIVTFLKVLSLTVLGAYWFVSMPVTHHLWNRESHALTTACRPAQTH